MTFLRRFALPLLATASVALLVGGLFGCAGVVAVVRGSSDYRVEQPTLPSLGALSSYHRGVPATAEHALRAFGEPDEIIQLGPERERWRYRTGLRFHGVALLLIVVPVPLLVPTGVHHAYVELERSTVVQVHGSQNAVVARIGCLIGPLARMFGDGGCFARWGTAPHTASLGSGELWLGPPPTLQRAPIEPPR